MTSPRETCHCRASCLSALRPHDATVTTPAGVVLAVHVDVPVASVVGLTSLVSPLSKRVAS